MKKTEWAMNWNLDEDGTLFITGEGTIPDYSVDGGAAAPWSGQRDRIRQIVIGSGITAVGIRAFESCENLERVFLPSSLTRIHSCAFRDCSRLTEVKTENEGAEFQYIYDERPVVLTNGKTLIRFGIGSFYRVPWALERWGDFYTADGILYTTLTADASLRVPDGIRRIEKFAFKDTQAVQIELPQTLKTIASFAFSDSKIQDLILPESIEEIEAYAFAGGSLAILEFPASSAWDPDACKMDESMFRNTAFRYRRYRRGKKKIPELFEMKTKADAKHYRGFRRIVFQRKAPKYSTEGAPAKGCYEGGSAGVSMKGCYGVGSVDVRDTLTRKMWRGSVFSAVICEGNRVAFIESYFYKRGRVFAYRMYPHRDGDALWFQDSFSSYENWEEESPFGKEEARLLIERDALRGRQDGMRETWFLSREPGKAGGPLETELLRLWLKNHPEMFIESGEERTDQESGEHAQDPFGESCGESALAG